MRENSERAGSATGGTGNGGKTDTEKPLLQLCCTPRTSALQPPSKSGDGFKNRPFSVQQRATPEVRKGA
jgi:hypothetical protein